MWVRKLRLGRKYTDRLVKVFLKDGEEQWILIHIEIQGYHDDYFGERMFMMFYRIFDRFYKKIVALAIFTEGESGYKPNSFDYNYFFTQLHYEYFTYKILEQKEEDLKNLLPWRFLLDYIHLIQRLMIKIDILIRKS